MARQGDELAGRRARMQVSPRSPESDQPPADPVERVAADASTPEVLDAAAGRRDEAATKRDGSAAERDVARESAGEDQQQSLSRVLAARDRAAAALDRYEASLDRHRAAQYLEHTYRDELTGVLQRQAGRDQFSNEVARAHRALQTLVVAFIDVDNLKQVNDEYGHLAGDFLLRAVGEALRRGLRAYDLIMRYGGDEFVCALPDCHLDEADRRFIDVRDGLTVAMGDASFSVGLVQLREEEQVDEVIARADLEMYARRTANAATDNR